MSAPARHGHTRGYKRTPAYETWQAMMSRCTRPSNVAYARYGGAGITVCERWRIFDNFLADMGERPAGKNIDRIDGAKGYEPGNCRWATSQEQARNRRSNKLLTFQGRTKAIAEWADEVGLNRDAITKRLRLGWTVERALTAPRRNYPTNRGGN